MINQYLSNRGPRLSLKTKEKWFGFFMALPGLVAVFATIIYPLLLGIVNSFRAVNLLRPQDATWNGFANYQKLFQDPFFWNAVNNTLIMTTAWTVGAAILGLLLAVLLNRETRLNRFISGSLLIPWILPGTVVGFIFAFMMQERIGIVNEVLLTSGLIAEKLKFFTSLELAKPSIIGLTIWMAFPFFMMMFLAALKTIPAELFEAAAIDGANALRIFWHITLPHLKNVIVIATTLSIVWGFNFIDLIFATTRGGPVSETETLVLLGYRMAFEVLDIGYVSALGVVWLLLLTVFSYIYLKTMEVF